MSDTPERSSKASTEAQPPSIDLFDLFRPEQKSNKNNASGDNASRENRTEQVAMLTKGADGKLEITEKDFDKIGPKAAQVLRDAGVTKLTVTPGKGFDTYEAELKKPLEIQQDPNVDGARKLKLGTHFKADVTKNADGSMTLDNIEGLTAESKILLKWRDASVDKINLKQTPDGKSEITSTGSWNGISRDQTREKPGDVFDKANLLFGRMENLKKGAQGEKFLEIPKLQNN